MGNSCSTPCKKLRNCCYQCFFCCCSQCECCAEPKARSAEINSLTTNPISSGLIMAPIDEHDCKFTSLSTFSNNQNAFFFSFLKCFNVTKSQKDAGKNDS